MKKPLYSGYTVAHNRPKSRFVEAIRDLRTNILFRDIESAPHALLFASANPAEGRTTMACNCAISLAQARYEVLLIDGDMRAPIINKVLSLENIGLSDALTKSESHEISKYIQQSKIQENLSVLTAGLSRQEPCELLCSQQMHDIMKALRESFDYIIFDSPPLQTYTDAAVLSTLTDAVLLIIKCNSTDVASASAALRSLKSVNARSINCVLNQYDENFE